MRRYLNFGAIVLMAPGNVPFAVSGGKLINRLAAAHPRHGLRTAGRGV